MSTQTIISETVIMIGGGELQKPCVENLKQMGLYVLLFDMNPDCVCAPLVDAFIPIDIRDTKACVQHSQQWAKEHPHHRVIGCVTAATDATYTVAQIQEALSLPTPISSEAAFILTHKWEMMQYFHRHHLPVPLTFVIPKDIQPSELAELQIPFENHKFVLKPTDNMGARGVIQIQSEQEFWDSYLHPFRFSKENYCLLEEFIEGEEISIEGFFVNQKFIPTTAADRWIQGLPYFIEIGHSIPSTQPQEAIDESFALLERLGNLLQINYAVLKGDVKITPEGKPVLLEVAGRLSGGFMSGYTTPLATKIPVTQRMIELSLWGKHDSLPRSLEYEGYTLEFALFPEEHSQFIRVEGIDIALQIPEVKYIFITAKTGQAFSKIENNVCKVGHIILHGATQEAVFQARDLALKSLRIVCEPL